MKRLSRASARSPEEVIDAAASFFGPGGLGLGIQDRSDRCVMFGGGGGFVRVWTSPADGGSTVDVETSEWEEPTARFLGAL